MDYLIPVLPTSISLDGLYMAGLTIVLFHVLILWSSVVQVQMIQSNNHHAIVQQK